MSILDRRLNVLFVMYQMGMGGSERLVYDLVCRLDRDRFNPSIAWFEGDAALDEFKALGVQLYHVKKTKRIDSEAMRHLSRIVRDGAIDIVNAQHFMPAVYCYYACKVRHQKVLVFTAHSRWEVEELQLKWRVVGGYLLGRTDASVGVSRDVSEAIRSVFRGRAANVVTIENGVDVECSGDDSDSWVLKRELGLPPECVVIGMVANFKTIKNHRLLLEAFAQLAAKVDRARLVLIGRGFEGDSGNTESVVREFVADRGLEAKIKILGYRADVRRLLRIVDVFCLTSLMEGLPISLIEAMASGAAVVGTNVPGIRDVIEPDRDGILVELGDVSGLKDVLTDLIEREELRMQLGRMARTKATERFSLQRCVSHYEDLFLRCVRARDC